MQKQQNSVSKNVVEEIYIDGKMQWVLSQKYSHYGFKINIEVRKCTE